MLNLTPIWCEVFIFLLATVLEFAAVHSLLPKGTIATSVLSSRRSLFTVSSLPPSATKKT